MATNKGPRNIELPSAIVLEAVPPSIDRYTFLDGFFTGGQNKVDTFCVLRDNDEGDEIFNSKVAEDRFKIPKIGLEPNDLDDDIGIQEELAKKLYETYGHTVAAGSFELFKVDFLDHEDKRMDNKQTRRVPLVAGLSGVIEVVGDTVQKLDYTFRRPEAIFHSFDMKLRFVKTNVYGFTEPLTREVLTEML